MAGGLSFAWRELLGRVFLVGSRYLYFESRSLAEVVDTILQAELEDS